MGDLAHSFTHREVAQEVLRSLIGLYAEQLHNAYHQSAIDAQSVAQMQSERGHLQRLLRTLPSCDDQVAQQLLTEYSPRVKVMAQARRQQSV